MPAQRPQAGARAARRDRAVASYEAEFYVWGSEGPLDRTPYAGSFALTPGAEFVAELARTLQEMGIRPEQCHAEVGHGNLELSVGEDEALAAADERVMVLEAIRGVAHKMGLETTMAPKPYLNAAGNGHHLHVSLYEGEDPVLFDGSGALSGPGRGLVGGLLEHLPAVMAFTAPSPNSYQRLAPGMWSSAFVAYGLDNKEAAIRLASPVAAGIRDGERRNQTRGRHLQPLPGPCCGPGRRDGRDWRGLDPGEPTMVDPATLSAEERAARASGRSPPPRTRRSRRWREVPSSSMRLANPRAHPRRRGAGAVSDGEGFRRKRWRPRRRSFTEGLGV